MANIIPAGVYGLRVPAGAGPIPASVDPAVAFRITMAAIDPSADPEFQDGDHKTPRATLKLIRIQGESDDEDDEDWEDEDGDDVDSLRARLLEAGVLGSDDDDSDLSEDESEEEANGGPSDPAKSKKAKREALEKKLKEELAAEEMELDQMTNGKSKGKGKAVNGDASSDSEDDDEDDDDDDAEVEELVLCTLDPEKHWQQTLEITVREGEEIYFSSNGTHDIYLSGNYVAIQDADDDNSEDGEYGMDYDMSPDEDELDEDISESEDDALDGLPNPRLMEVDSEEEEAPKLIKADKKNKNKRAAESDDEGATLDELISKTKAEAPTTNGEPKLSKKQAKKLKNNEGQAVPAAQEPAKKQTKEKAEKAEKADASDKKKVQFAKNLELGPTGSPKVEEKTAKPANNPRSVQGVTVDDKKDGKGRPAKAGDKIEMRYIGKLTNGKMFDSNKKGKPFSFKLGVGEVIKGWDVGVVGMKAGGERRLTIPAKLAYGGKALPGIPANSELVFDIKCISVN